MRTLLQRLARPLLILGLLLFIASGIPAFGHTLVAYEGTLLSVDQNISAVTYQGQSILTKDGHVDVAKFTWTPDHTWQSFPIQITQNGQTQAGDFLVLDRWLVAGGAGLGLVLVLLTLPSLFTSTNVRSRGTTTPIRGWNYLLTDHDGLSLARLQLFIWFLPGIITYAILAWPTHTFPSVPSSLWMLLGLGGATAAISGSVSNQPNSSASANGGGNGGGEPAPAPAPDPVAVATAAQQVRQVFQQAAAGLQHLTGNPTAADAASIAAQAQAAEAALQQVAAAADSLQQAASTPAQYVYAAPPRFADLVEDQNGYGDVSRYQYLILCVIGGAIFLVTFLQTWQVPTLPDQFVPLVATSQATYLVVKSIKFVRGLPSSKS